MKTKFIKILKITGIIMASLYVILCSLFYFNQEKLFLFPDQLAADHQFDFNEKFEEINLTTTDGIVLNSLLFKADSTKGVVFFLHGNGGSLDRFGKQAEFYTSIGYDVFMTDYRGYGKSEGSIKSENQFHRDNQFVYDEFKKLYSEDEVIIVGYSMGGALASKLASANNPKSLILLAPFCGGDEYATKPEDIIEEPLTMKIAKLLPIDLLVKYELKTNEFIKNCKVPVLILHGDADEAIPHGSSLKLKEDFKSGDRLIILEGEEHRAITTNPIYQIELIKLLEK